MANSLTFVAPDGTELSMLAGADIQAMWGVTGRLMPPVSLDTVNVRSGGARITAARYDGQLLTVPLVIRPDNYEAAREAMATALDPEAGIGYLRSVAGDSTRILYCRYAGGAEGLEDSPEMQMVQVTFQADGEPFWMDSTETVLSASLGEGLPTWFNDGAGIPPLTLAPSGVDTQFTIDNDGQKEAWPVWLVTGPATVVTLTNDTTGEVLQLTVEVASGEAITIDTRPDYKTVVDADGTNRFSDLSLASTLWPLVKGEQTVSVQFGTGSAASSAQLTYARRWLTA